jgi:hypothetical protein
MNRFLRRTLYSLKRQYGGRVDVYQLGSTDTDYETGDKTSTHSMIMVSKCIVLPVKIQREAVQSISVISANKTFVYGGTYDAGSRMFIIDARDLPSDYEIVNDDWLVYDNRRYDIKDITEFEQHTGWIITGREVKGVRPEQIFYMAADNTLDMGQEITTGLGTAHFAVSSSELLLLQEILSQVVINPANVLGFSQEVTANLIEFDACLAVNWEDVGVAYWANYQTCINNTVEISGSSSTSLPGTLAGVDKWRGGVLAPNGYIYGIPFDSVTILKIDSSDDSTSTFGNLTNSRKWSAGVLAPNGNIYGIPYNDTAFLKLVPGPDTITTHGALSGSTSKWVGGVLAATGFIYGIPLNAAQILKINPSTDTAAAFGSISGSSKYMGGVLAPNDMIYCIPHTNTQVLKIDPSDDSTSLVGSTHSGSQKWRGGVLAANGMIYGIPYISTSILKIDPSDDTTSTFGTVAGNGGWFGGVLAPNGMIYAISYDGSTVLRINPNDDTVTTFGSPGVAGGKWVGGVLATEGHIYGIPCDATTLLRIDPDSAAALSAEIILSAYFNKF